MATSPYIGWQDKPDYPEKSTESIRNFPSRYYPTGLKKLIACFKRHVAPPIDFVVRASWCADLSFPPGFQFGVATASFQVEGAWNVSDKSESIWDRLTHQHPEYMRDGSNGDIACDSYHLWKEDVQLAKNLGVHFYRFSIAWPRLLPTGFSNYISEDGANYYNNLIDELLANGIEPVITLYHWDLPQSLQDLGGWTNPLIADWFADYARVAYTLYADRVKTWLTINEPLIVCDAAYNGWNMAPGLMDPDRAAYLCNKYLLIAHAKAWRIYDEEFKPTYHGQVSIANHLFWFEPATPDDVELTELAKEYCIGRYSHPIYSKEGGWPPAIEEIVAENSRLQGYSRSRLPAFTDEEKQLVRGTYDFFGFNHYVSRLVRSPRDGEEVTSWPLMWGIPELNGVLENDEDWGIGASEFFSVFPEGLRRVLLHLKNNYGDLPFLITENGYGNSEFGLEDDERINYFHIYLEQTLLSIKEDGVNVTGFTAWTLIDNFEWTDGYTTKFGLHQVDFSDPGRRRTPRKSAHYYNTVISSHSLDVPKP